MKERVLLSVSILVSAALILTGLVILSVTIRDRPIAGTPHFPSSIEVAMNQDNEYMSEWQAMGYLYMNDDQFFSLLASGALDGTYALFEASKQTHGPSETENTYIFSKSKLDEWLNARIEAQG